MQASQPVNQLTDALNHTHTTDLVEASANLKQSQVQALPEPHSTRTLKHRRTFCYEVYERAYGLWDIDCQMIDRKTYDFTLASQTRPVGEPLHSMVLRVTVDAQLFIVDAIAQTLAAPYLTQCATINPDYHQMVGLNLAKDFRAGLKQRFAGTAGCTHLTELANSLPTVAIQGIAVELTVRQRQAISEEQAGRPFQIGQCHALAEHAQATQLYYPKWYTPKTTPTK